MKVAGRLRRKTVDHQHHQHHGQHQFEFHVGHRGADGLGAVGQDLHIHRARQAGLDLGQHFLDGIHHLR